jgi:glycogen(starch) synthase
MRILTVGNMYPPHHMGGYELIWRSWVAHAESCDHAVRVLTTDFELESGPIEGLEESGDVHRDLRWYWHDHEFPRLSGRARWAIERHNARMIERHLQEFVPDVVVWWAMAGMSLSSIERVRRAGIPAVAVLGDYWLEYGPTVDAWMRVFLKRPGLARLVEGLTGQITRADLASGIKFVFVSETLRRRAHEIWADLAESEVIHHEPPDIELFQPAAVRAWEGKLLYVGRIDHVKGVDLAILALLDLPDEATLTIVGSGNREYLGDLHRIVREHDLDGRVRFDLRRRTELPATYADADAVLFPVRWAEPFGLVPLEAMAIGRPVVASGRGGSGEYLEDGANCLIFDPSEGPAALAASVQNLAADASLRDRLRAGGFRTVESIRAERFNDRVLATVERARASHRGGRPASLGRARGRTTLHCLRFHGTVRGGVRAWRFHACALPLSPRLSGSTARPGGVGELVLPRRRIH